MVVIRGRKASRTERDIYIAWDGHKWSKDHRVALVLKVSRQLQ